MKRTLVRTPASFASVSATSGEQLLGEDRRHVLSLNQPLQLGDALGTRLGVGSEPADRVLRQAVRGGEVSERRVVRDDDAPRTRRESLCEVVVERGQVGGERLRVRRERVGVSRRDAGERCFDRLAHLGVEHRIQPDVRVDRDAVAALSRRRCQRGQIGEQVDRDTSRIGDRVLDGGLKSLTQVEHEVGRLDRRDGVGCELQVVRLHARRREVHDVDVVSADRFDGCLDGVERRDHRYPALRPGAALIARRARGSEQHQRRERDVDGGDVPGSENCSHT